MHDRTARQAREDQALAELDRYARQAREAGKTARLGALFIIVVLLAAFWAGYMAPTPEADSAVRPVYTGTVTICYAPAPAKADPNDQYLTRQWAAVLPAAIAAAQPAIGKVRVVTEQYPHSTCTGAVSVWSSPAAYVNRAAKPYSVYTYGEGRAMWESQVTMGDKVGAQATPAQRQAWLAAALKTAIPR